MSAALPLPYSPKALTNVGLELSSHENTFNSKNPKVTWPNTDIGDIDAPSKLVHCKLNTSPLAWLFSLLALLLISLDNLQFKSPLDVLLARTSDLFGHHSETLEGTTQQDRLVPSSWVRIWRQAVSKAQFDP